MTSPPPSSTASSTTPGASAPTATSPTAPPAAPRSTAQRRLKARLSAAREVEAPDALTERLLRLSVPLDEPRPRDVRPPTRPPAGPPVASRPGRAAAPAGERPSRARQARRCAAGPPPARRCALLGVAAALALGAPQPRPATTPVDPATDAFVTEFVSTTADGASTAVPAPTARPAGLTTFVPLTRTALLSTGGARTTR